VHSTPSRHRHQPHPQAPDKPTYVDIDFEKGDPVAIDGVKMSPATILTKLNELGGNNGIGRVDIVESRFVGGCGWGPRQGERRAGKNTHKKEVQTA
jgi:argininosuccinate synthase